MAMVFSLFDALGSIRQTHRWFHDERVELPVNKAVRGRFELRWQAAAMPPHPEGDEKTWGGPAFSHKTAGGGRDNDLPGAR
ncbi:MAG: hypothetical protein Q8M01_22275 [Rubrivivax sp.]|nr:hypothetical protein [Rubrivivax sp.]